MNEWRIEYFEALTQIGPVLLLAYVLEARFHTRGVSRAVQAARGFGLLTTLMAEAIALGVVAGEIPNKRETGLLLGAVLTLGAAYLPMALAGGKRPEDPVDRRVADANMIVSLLFGVASLALFVIATVT